MKYLVFLCLCNLCSIISFGQNINLDQASPEPDFQDADVGSIALGDIDNDGDLDFVATGKGGPIKSSLYTNDGFGNFTEVVNAPLVNVNDGTVGFADLNNDSFLDLLITGNTSSPLATANLYMNDGTGNFSLSLGTPFEPSSGGDFAFGDVDGDNDLDVIMSGYDSSELGFTTLYLNNGLGVFSEDFGTSFVGLKNSSVAFIDIENDNDLDILIMGEQNNGMLSTMLHINDGLGNFSLVIDTPFPNCNFGDIAIADSDNDGDDDILITGTSDSFGTISYLYANGGLGTFSHVEETPFIGTFVGANNFADFDADGDLDVLIIGAATGSVVSHIYENLGENNFVLADMLYGAYLSSTAVGDIDGDEDLDIIIAGTSFQLPTRSTKTYLNLGACAGSEFAGCIDPQACNYDSIATCNDGSCIYSLCISCEGDADLNSTVDVLDLVSVSSNFGCISGCLGNGDANFDETVNILDLIAVSSNFASICP